MREYGFPLNDSFIENIIKEEEKNEDINLIGKKREREIKEN